MRELSAIFQGMLDTFEARTPPPATISHGSDEAATALQSVLNETILPRRITVRAESGARLSVVAKSRRVIKIAEVHPPEFWQFETGPQDTPCTADYDAFACPFASAFVKVVGGKPIQIEQALVEDSLGKTGAGYPATKLVDHVEQSQKRVPASEQVGVFFDAFPNLARARFGDETVIECPEATDVTSEWMQDKINGVRDSLAEKETDVRFLTLSGDKPRALALVWIDGAGCIVVADKTEAFDALENSLDALRPYL